MIENDFIPGDWKTGERVIISKCIPGDYQNVLREIDCIPGD